MFRQATKLEARLRLGISGPSGSGKTYTALAVATHLAKDGRIAVVDTEHGSASKYSDLFAFDVVNFDPPFHPDRFVEAIHKAEDMGYDVLVIDSISHAWSGTGGLLEIVDAAKVRFKGNTYMAWSEGTPIQNRLVESIVGSSIHVIVTMRSKTEYVIYNENGKSVPKKVGMAPIQRDGFEFELDVLLDMDMENNGVVQKTRCPALTGAGISKPGRELAETLLEWLGGQKPPTEEELRQQAIEAESLDDWTYAAHRLPGPANVFESEQRLADWYSFVTGNGFVPELNADLLQLAESYANSVTDGARVKEAAETARTGYLELKEALAAVDEVEEEEE